MKRNDDTVREILMRMEDDENWIKIFSLTSSTTEEEFAEIYHVNLLMDAGLVTSVGKDTYRLTNQGHDYIEAIRDDGIWEKTKSQVAETGGNATLDIIRQLALAALKKKISEHTGIDL